MHKLLSIVGARPQFVKEAVVQHEIARHPNLQEVVVHTGQHYDSNMSGTFFELFHMKKPDYNLGISGGSHGKMTGEMLIALEPIFQKEAPDLVLLYGDTNSTLAGALAAAKLKIPVAHIEAGLRQNPKDMPEEINRVLTDHTAAYLFAPSERAIDNLAAEGLQNNVYFSGDVMYDVFLHMKPRFIDDYYKQLGLEEGRYIVLTMHRDFNVDTKEQLEPLLRSLATINREVPIVFPIHPRTRQRIAEFHLESILDGWHVVEPLDYLQLMGLTQHCLLAITDSGGYQKETYFSGKNALVLMEDTSWIELVEEGVNTLTDVAHLVEDFQRMTDVRVKEGIYGSGDAAKKIIATAEKSLSDHLLK